MARRRVKKSEENVVIGVQEPVRKSLLDLVEYNLKKANRVTSIIRLTLVGEHNFDSLPDHPIEQVFENIVHQVNNSYVEEALTGLLLYYQKYYCHLLEGSEDALYKFLDTLLKNETYASCIGETRVMENTHYVKQRVAFEWLTYTGMPPTLLEKLDPNAPFAECRGICINAMFKMQQLAVAIYKDKVKERERAKEAVDRDTAEFPEIRSATSSDVDIKVYEKRSTFMSGMVVSLDRHRDHLIEIGKMDFLSKTYYLRRLEAFYDLRKIMRTADYYRDATWPVESDYIPYYIFDKPYDPVIDLPSGIAKKEDEEAEEPLSADPSANELAAKSV